MQDAQEGERRGTAGAAGELLCLHVAESWPFTISARDVARTEGLNHRPAHDVRAVVDPSSPNVEHLAALVPLHLIEGTTDREAFLEAKMTSIKVWRTGTLRCATNLKFNSDPTGTLAVVSIVVQSARCIVQLARAGREVQAKRNAKGEWQSSVVYTPSKESFGRAELRMLRKLLAVGWFTVGLIAINGPNDATVPSSQEY